MRKYILVFSSSTMIIFLMLSVCFADSAGWLYDEGVKNFKKDSYLQASKYLFAYLQIDVDYLRNHNDFKRKVNKMLIFCEDRINDIYEQNERLRGVLKVQDALKGNLTMESTGTMEVHYPEKPIIPKRPRNKKKAKSPCQPVNDYIMRGIKKCRGVKKSTEIYYLLNNCDCVKAFSMRKIKRYLREKDCLD